MDGNYPRFDEAVERFRRFLSSQGVPPDIIWVSPDNVVQVNSQIFIRRSDPEIARKRASSDYLRGCDQRLGVTLGVLCQIGSIVYCYVDFPKDEDEAARHMMPDGLKLTHPVPVPNGRIVTNRLQWFCVSRWIAKRSESQKAFLFP